MEPAAGRIGTMIYNRLDMREHAASALAPAVLIGEFVALGANSSLLGTAAGLAAMLTAGNILLLLPPRAGFWMRLGPLLLPFALALGWAALPLALPGPMASARWAAPGAFAASFVTLLGILMWIPIGAMMGARARVSQRSVDLLLVFGLVWIICSLIAYKVDPGRVWGIDLGLQKRRFSATLLNPNTAGCAMAMIAVLAASRFLLVAGAAPDAYAREKAKGLVTLVGSWFVTMLAFVGMVLAGSRLAIVLAALGLLVAVVRAWVKALYRPRFYAVSLATLLVPLVLGGIVGGTRLARKMVSTAGDAALRWEDTKFYAHLSFESPWFGYGLGGFRNVNLANLDAGFVLHRWNFGAAHNVLLHGAIEGGWPFALLATGGIVLAAAFVVRGSRRSSLDTLRVGLLLAVAIALGCGLGDIALNVPALAALAAWLGGLVLGRFIQAAAEEEAFHQARPEAGSQL